MTLPSCEAVLFWMLNPYFSKYSFIYFLHEIIGKRYEGSLTNAYCAWIFIYFPVLFVEIALFPNGKVFFFQIIMLFHKIIGQDTSKKSLCEKFNLWWSEW